MNYENNNNPQNMRIDATENVRYSQGDVGLNNLQQKLKDAYQQNKSPNRFFSPGYRDVGVSHISRINNCQNFSELQMELKDILSEIKEAAYSCVESNLKKVIEETLSIIPSTDEEYSKSNLMI